MGAVIIYVAFAVIKQRVVGTSGIIGFFVRLIQCQDDLIRDRFVQFPGDFSGEFSDEKIVGKQIAFAPERIYCGVVVSHFIFPSDG